MMSISKIKAMRYFSLKNENNIILFFVYLLTNKIFLFKNKWKI